jgi:hypothetical protein
MSAAPMTQTDYVAMDGGCCPFCGGTDIVGGVITIAEGAAHQEVGCNECDREWNDTYKLTGYQEI